MLLAASLNDHKLILECYHPSSKNTEPYLFCDYLGTPGLTRRTEGDDSLYSDNGRPLGIGDLKGIYSRFRPIRPEAEELIFRPHPAGDVPGRPGPSAMSSDDSPRTECVKYNISLDSYELFSQLCVVANLVQLGPRRGVFYSFVNVADGVVRIWRAWLADKAKNVDSATGDKSVLGLTDLETKRHQGHAGFSANDSNGEDRMLWVDNDKTVGIRVRVKERKWRRDVPILVHNDEDLAVSYTMEYEGMWISSVAQIFSGVWILYDFKYLQAPLHFENCMLCSG